MIKIEAFFLTEKMNVSPLNFAIVQWPHHIYSYIFSSKQIRLSPFTLRIFSLLTHWKTNYCTKNMSPFWIDKIWYWHTTLIKRELNSRKNILIEVTLLLNVYPCPFLLLLFYIPNIRYFHQPKYCSIDDISSRNNSTSINNSTTNAFFVAIMSRVEKVR